MNFTKTPEGKETNNFLDCRVSEAKETEKIAKDGRELMVSIEDIEKMDAILKIKTAEEKKAKLERFQTEEESRTLLFALPPITFSKGLQANCEEFMRFLNETEATETDAISCFSRPEEKKQFINEVVDRNWKAEKKGNQKRNALKFVEKNIALAKCSGGTLSLTEQEKCRIESLLKDKEDLDSTNANSNLAVENEFYAIDGETKAKLSEIDRKLEAFSSGLSLNSFQSELRILEKKENKSERKESQSKIIKNGDKKKSRIQEIDKILEEINSVSNTEIIPLAKEEIQSLIHSSKQSLALEKTIDSKKEETERVGYEVPKPAHKLIADLISTAKLQMPKFKYRFDES